MKKEFIVKIKVVKKYKVYVNAENEEEALKEAKEKYSGIEDDLQAYSTDIDYQSAKESKQIKIEYDKTLEEYMKKFGEAYNNGDLWDFSAEDVNGGAIDLDPEQVYWEIDGRLYETKVL